MPTDPYVVGRPVAHLPLVRGVVEQLGILDVVDELCPKHPLNKVSDAECVLAIVYNVLCGRPALYRMEEWLGQLDVEVLFGTGVDPAAFNDTRLAETLDRIDEAGSDNILSRVATGFLARPEQPREFVAHHDTTSVVLFGAFLGDDEPKPAYGFSKDHRPDLKQLIYGLTLHGAAGIPLVATVQAGNTPDSTVARDHLARLVPLLPEEHEVTLVGDCKLVDPRTLGRILCAGLHFVSLVPDSYKLRRELIDEAFVREPDPSAWPKLAEKPGPRKENDLRHYRGSSVVRPFRTLLEDAAPGEDAEEKAPESQEDLRFLVVYSEVLAAKFDAALDERLKREADGLDKAAKKLNKRGFDCEEDARTASESLATKAKLHRVDLAFVEEEELVKRAGPGRPRKDEAPVVRRVWRVRATHTVDKAKVAAKRKRAGCFVLVTDWLEGWSDERILGEYRHQYLVEGHTGFRWLKGPAAVAPVFLKTPGRIRAMGLILVLALMVRNYIQATMRAALRKSGETLLHPFTKKPEKKLTTEMAFEHFGGVHTQVLHTDDETRRLPVKLRSEALRILAFFRLDAAVFQPPSRRSDRKSRQQVGRTPGT